MRPLIIVAKMINLDIQNNDGSILKKIYKCITVNGTFLYREIKKNRNGKKYCKKYEIKTNLLAYINIFTTHFNQVP